VWQFSAQKSQKSELGFRSAVRTAVQYVGTGPTFFLVRSNSSLSIMLIARVVRHTLG